MLFNTKVFILLALLGAAIAQDYDGNYGGGDYQGGQEDDFGFGGFDDDDGFAAAAAGSAPKPGRGRAAAPSYPGPEGGSNFEAGSPYEGASPDAGAGGQDFSSVLREGGSPFGSASNAKPKMAPRQK
ncbi:hypothetical protein HDE_00419 [Halotydeus destructor]|nr:hypothetical protein HDE_00419 [Halotydeus destructor]